MSVTTIKNSRQALADKDDLEYLITTHFWMPSSRSCFCGARPDVPRASHIVWQAAHIADTLIAEGFGRVSI